MIEQAKSSLGRRIAEFREKRGWTQKQLSVATGISVTFLSEVENGKRNIGSESLLRVANALGATLDYLMKGEVEIVSKAALVVPPELEEAAEQHAWTFAEVSTLLKAHQMVLARRSGSSEASDRRQSKEDWENLYNRIVNNART